MSDLIEILVTKKQGDWWHAEWDSGQTSLSGGSLDTLYEKLIYVLGDGTPMRWIMREEQGK
jgi:hypothetical protein